VAFSFANVTAHSYRAAELAIISEVSGPIAVPEFIANLPQKYDNHEYEQNS
jgi:hypothetical protein